MESREREGESDDVRSLSTCVESVTRYREIDATTASGASLFASRVDS